MADEAGKLHHPDDATVGDASGTSQKDSAEHHAKPGTAKPQEEQQEKKTSLLQRVWQKSGLDAPTVMMMFKGSLPPTIAIAMYQSDAVASFYGALGYLIAITSVLGMSVFPRGMFIQNM